jgi:predicted DCC family thiol-disulfide oxidoreductase YuxK
MEATVLYDAGCGLCRWTAERLRRWDRAGRLRFVPLGTDEADELLPNLTPEERAASWHLVTPDERVASGGAAVAPVLDLLPAGRGLAALAGRFPGATDRAYRIVADHRDRIGGWLGTRACDVDPSAPRPSSRP